MPTSIRALFLNDFTAHFEEIDKVLELAGIKPEGYQVKDKADFLRKLAKYNPHVILISVEVLQLESHNHFHVEQVQSWLDEQNLTIPIWLIINPEDEAIALEAMYKGLSDYFFTDRLARIGPFAADLIGYSKQAFERVDLNQLIEEYLGENQALLKGKNAKLTFLPGADLPSVLGEQRSLSQVVFSLLSETEKNTSSRIRANIRTYLHAVKSEVCLEIKLKGEIYQQENNFDLMLAQKIVERHNGRIDIDHDSGSDMRICASFPAILEGQIKDDANLLIVENSHLMRTILQEGLEYEGFTVVVAENGAEALKKMTDFQPDLIISDVVMPIMDGFTFFNAVREQPQWQQIPFIFVTGQSEQIEELNALALGGATYLIKPIIIEELLVAVRSRLPS